MLDFRIKTFLSVCNTQNYTRTAEELHITQPAVSQHINFLEKMYGVSLFSKVGRSIQITYAGEILYEKLRNMQNDEVIMKNILKSAEGKNPTLEFGVTMTIGEYGIAKPISEFLRKHPNQNLHICFGNTEELLNKLDNGEISFALVEGYFPKNKYGNLVYSRELFIPVCHKDHKFKNPVNSLNDLLDQRLLVREEGSGTRNILERNLALSGLSISDFKYSVMVENMHTIIGLLKEDVGITFLYGIAVEEEFRSGILREIKLPDFKMKHEFTFLWRKDSIFAQDYKAICKELSEYHF